MTDTTITWSTPNTSTYYFCGWDFDDRETVPADPYNDNDGGSICAGCRTAKEDHKNEPPR